MRGVLACFAFASMVYLSGCAKKEDAEAAKQADSVTASQGGGAHVSVHLQDGSRIPGTIVASNQTDLVVMGDDGIERKIPLGQVKSVEYGAAATRRAATSQPSHRPATAPRAAPGGTAEPAVSVPAPPAPPPPVITTKTFELAVGSEVSVRTNEAIDSATASEGQTFDAEVTRDAKDSVGDIVAG